MRTYLRPIHALIAALLLAAAISAAPASAAAPETTVYPAAGPAGTRFSVQADGYRGNEEIDIWVNTPGGRAIAARPDAEAQRRASRAGRIALSWTSPADAAPGTWSLVARGQRSAVERVFLLTIVPPAAPIAADSGAQPEQGPPGTHFALYAAGFAADDLLSFYLTVPGGQPKLTEPQEARAYNGRVDWIWQAPADAAPGAYSFRVDGKSGRSVTVGWSVAAPQGAATGVQPAIGRSGALFIFYADGFMGREDVIYWVDMPGGRSVAIEPEQDRVDKGRADWSWQAPLDAAPGVWRMIAHGQDSKVERVITFTIR